MTADLTPVQQLQTEMGVEFYEWDGWPWPSNFGNPVEEYLAARNGVGIVENSGLRKWELRGPDALRAADSHRHSGPARTCRSAASTTRRSATRRAWRSTTSPSSTSGPSGSCSCPGCWPARRTSAPSAEGFDVELVPVSDERGGVQIQGPLSTGRRRPSHGRRSRRARVLPLHASRGRRGGVHPLPHRLQRRARLRDLRLARRGRDVWTALLEAGADFGIRPYGLEAADYLRVESGLIFVTFDYQPGELSPYELGLRLGRQARQGRLRREGRA